MKPQRTFRLRVSRSARGKQYSISVPIDIGLQLEPAGKIDFIIELTEQGLLYRPISHGVPVSPSGLR